MDRMLNIQRAKSAGTGDFRYPDLGDKEQLLHPKTTPRKERATQQSGLGSLESGGAHRTSALSSFGVKALSCLLSVGPCRSCPLNDCVGNGPGTAIGVVTRPHIASCAMNSPRPPCLGIAWPAPSRRYADVSNCKKKRIRQRRLDTLYSDILPGKGRRVEHRVQESRSLPGRTQPSEEGTGGAVHPRPQPLGPNQTKPWEGFPRLGLFCRPNLLVSRFRLTRLARAPAFSPGDHLETLLREPLAGSADDCLDLEVRKNKKRLNRFPPFFTDTRTVRPPPLPAFVFLPPNIFWPLALAAVGLRVDD